MRHMTILALAAAFAVLVALAPAILWMLLDDKVAEVFGNPRLATFSFWQAWSICALFSMVFKSHSSSKASSKEK